MVRLLRHPHGWTTSWSYILALDPPTMASYITPRATIKHIHRRALARRLLLSESRGNQEYRLVTKGCLIQANTRPFTNKVPV